jgi:hypothetical protein
MQNCHNDWSMLANHGLWFAVLHLRIHSITVDIVKYNIINEFYLLGTYDCEIKT